MQHRLGAVSKEMFERKLLGQSQCFSVKYGDSERSSDLLVISGS
jgi:hypothetical protein